MSGADQLRRTHLGSVQAPASGTPYSPEAECERLLIKLREVMQSSGIQHGDPLMPMFGVLELFIQVVCDRTIQVDRAVRDGVERISDTVVQSRLTADTEIKRAQTLITKMTTETVYNLGPEIARIADTAFTRRVKVIDRNTLLAYVSSGIIVTLAAVFGGNSLGRTSAQAAITATVGNVEISLGNRPDDASIVAALAIQNPLADELKECQSGRAQTWIQDGRHVCDLPVYLDASPAATLPPPPAPVTAAPRLLPSAPTAWTLPGRPPTGPVEFH